MINLTQSILPIIGYAFILAMIINAINVCFWEGHIFEKIGDRFEDYKWWKPVVGCIICMVPWWGAAICVPLNWPVLSIPVAMGINTLIVRWSPKEEIDVINHY
jgi:hypothetical protein